MQNGRCSRGVRKTVKPTYGYDHRSVFLLCTGAGAPKDPFCKGELSAKQTEGLTTPSSRIEDFVHLPLHKGGFGAVQNRIIRTTPNGV